jgi:hypothetical protein
MEKRMGSSSRDKARINFSRRALIKGGIALVAGGTLLGVFAPDILKLLSNANHSTAKTTTTGSSIESTLTTTTTKETPIVSTSESATSGSASPQKFMNRVANILQAHGITKRGFVDYGGFDIASTVFPNVQTAVQTYAKYGFLVFPFIDISEGTSNIAHVISQAMPYLKQVGGGVLGPTYYWGYETQFYGNIVQSNPNDQEFKYDPTTQTFQPALAFGTYPGVMIDSPALLPYFRQAYEQIAAALPDGYDDLIAISGDPLADHPINYGNSGGANMNSYVRFVNSNFYSAQVTNGVHSDGSLCVLWSLVGKSPIYVSVELSILSNNPIVPPLSMYNDIQTYHSGGQLSSPPTGFGGYLGKANETLEAGILSFLASQARIAPFDRTDVPLQYIQMDQNFNSTPKIILSTGTDYSLFMATGGDVGTPWLNYANPDDNESNNPPVHGGYGVATAATVLNYFLSIYPAFMHLQLGDVDTDPSQIVPQSTATPWGKYSSIIDKMGDYSGGFFGYENGQNVLFLSSGFSPKMHYVPGLVGHTFGLNSGDTFSDYFQHYGEYVKSLDDFKVVVGWPSNPNDQNSLSQWVSNDGTLILLANFHQPGDKSFPSTLAGVSIAAGGGELGTVQIPDHPLLTPYTSSDINSAYSSATTIGSSTRTVLDPSNVTTIIGDSKYGPSMWIHKVGNGEVIVLPQTYYGEGLTLNSQGQGDCFASGLTFLLLNAIAYGEGLPSGGVYMQQNGSPKFQWRTSWANPLDLNQEGSFSNFIITVCGLKRGRKIVLLSNLKTSPLNPGIGLSKAYFNFGTSGNATDLITGNSLPIGSSDFLTEFNIPAQDWTVFLL